MKMTISIRIAIGMCFAGRIVIDQMLGSRENSAPITRRPISRLPLRAARIACGPGGVSF
jgi:hypothetical protein